MVGVLKKLELLTGINKNLALIFGIIIFLTRVTGDSILFLLNQISTPTIIIWKSLTAFPIILALSFYFFKEIVNQENIKIDDSTKNFFKDFILLVVLASVLFITDFIIPTTIFFPKVANNIFGIILIDFVSLYSILIGILTFSFLYKWLYFFRQKKTRIYLHLIFFVYIFCIIAEYHQSFFSNKSEFLEVLSIILFVIAGFLGFILPKNSWIITIPRSRKYILLLVSLTIIIVSIILNITLSQHNNKLSFALYMFLPGSNIIIFIPLLLTSIIFFRIFLTTLTSLPTSQLVEQQIYEIKSLEYLNRIIAETVDFNQLIKTVTELACSVSHANSAWIEVCQDNCSKYHTYSYNIDDETIKKLKDNQLFRSFIENLSQPFFLSSIKEHNDQVFNDFLEQNIAKSIIAIPIFSTSDKIGTIVVLHKEEYGFQLVDLNVLSAYSHNISIALENARLLKDSLEKESLKRELNIAKDIQNKLLPTKLPEIDNYSLYWFTMPALEVGGDFFFIIQLKNGKYCILIGDVSGKGMNAAFYMAQLKGVVLSVAKESVSPADVLKRINAILYKAMERQMFITLSALVIENEFGLLTLARAGHMPAIFVRDGKIEEITPKGIGIGLADSSVFDKIIEEKTIQLENNDKCIMITDGVIEAKNIKNEEFSLDNLKQIIKETVYSNRDGLIFDIKNYIEDFIKDGEQIDDLTVVVLEYKYKK